MPHLVFINGSPGVGKSTLAQHIHKEIDVPLLSKDDIKEFLMDKLGIKDEQWTQLMGKAAVSMLFEYAEQMLGAGKDIIIENAFWVEFAKPQLNKICQITGAMPLELYCFTDNETRNQRAETRIRNHERHPGHTDHFQVIDAAVADGVYDPLCIGKVIMVDTTNLQSAGYKDVIKQIKLFLNEKGSVND